MRSLNSEILKEPHFLDVGAGCGYMVGALQRLGCLARGVEVSKEEVDYGNRMLGSRSLEALPQEKMAAAVKNAPEQVLSFIGVLEHISDLSQTLKSVQDNKNIQYLFFSVPMFSLSNIFGVVFPEVFNRQIGYAHTHLFSRASLEWMCKTYGFEPLAEWNFGSDIMDLYRSIMTRLQPRNKLSGIVSEFFESNGDAMQLLVDKYHFCSEIHILAKVVHSSLPQSRE